ncbi:hypothetical protein DFH09DRAFT_1300282 [Mycena vulgaris]|nr:hypothetical protein DFH09DRAFT_1300282 [Mycena vulgaris]
MGRRALLFSSSSLDDAALPPAVPLSLPDQAMNRSSPATAAKQDSDEEGTGAVVALTYTKRAHAAAPIRRDLRRVRGGLSRVGVLPYWTSVRRAACAIFLLLEYYPASSDEASFDDSARPPSPAASSDDADIEKQNMTRSAAAPERNSDDEDADSDILEAVSLTHAKQTARTQEAARAQAAAG